MARGRLVLLALAALAALAVGGTCDSGRRRLREAQNLDAVELLELGITADATGGAAEGDGAGAWGLRLGNETSPDGGGEEDGDDGDDGGSLLPPPSFSLLSDELADRCRSECETPRENDCVADLSANCNATVNNECPSCGLWRDIRECLASLTKRDCGGMGPPVYYAPSNALVPLAANWIVMPLEPVVGVENLARGDAGRSTADAWMYGWDDAVAGTSERPRIPARDLTVMINSRDQRKYHSLHLHVGRKSAAWAACSNFLPTPPRGVWWRATCTGLSARSTAEVTKLEYLWPVGGRANILAAAQEGLERVGRSATAGVALVAYPHATSDENLVVIFDGVEVNDHMLLRQ